MPRASATVPRHFSSRPSSPPAAPATLTDRASRPRRAQKSEAEIMREQEEKLKAKFGGLAPKKKLIHKDVKYFDSADYSMHKQKHEDAKVTANEPYKTFVTSPEMVEQFSEALPHIYNKCVPPPGLAQVDGEEVNVTVEKCLAALREMKQADEDANANSANTSTSSSTSSTSSVTSPPPSLPSPPSSPSLVAPPIAPVAPVDTTTVKSDVSNGEAAPMVPVDVKMDETSSSSDDSDEDDEEDEATQLILQDMEDNLEEE